MSTHVAPGPGVLTVWHESLFSAREDLASELSETGVVIHTDRPLPVGTHVFVELPARPGEIRAGADAEVQDTTPGGMRVVFRELDEAARAEVMRLAVSAPSHVAASQRPAATPPRTKPTATAAAPSPPPPEEPTLLDQDLGSLPDEVTAPDGNVAAMDDDVTQQAPGVSAFANQVTEAGRPLPSADTAPPVAHDEATLADVPATPVPTGESAVEPPAPRAATGPFDELLETAAPADAPAAQAPALADADDSTFADILLPHAAGDLDPSPIPAAAKPDPNSVPPPARAPQGPAAAQGTGASLPPDEEYPDLFGDLAEPDQADADAAAQPLGQGQPLGDLEAPNADASGAASEPVPDLLEDSADPAAAATAPEDGNDAAWDLGVPESSLASEPGDEADAAALELSEDPGALLDTAAAAPGSDETDAGLDLLPDLGGGDAPSAGKPGDEDAAADAADPGQDADIAALEAPDLLADLGPPPGAADPGQDADAAALDPPDLMADLEAPSAMVDAGQDADAAALDPPDLMADLEAPSATVDGGQPADAAALVPPELLADLEAPPAFEAHPESAPEAGVAVQPPEPTESADLFGDLAEPADQAPPAMPAAPPALEPPPPQLTAPDLAAGDPSANPLSGVSAPEEWNLEDLKTPPPVAVSPPEQPAEPPPAADAFADLSPPATPPPAPQEPAAPTFLGDPADPDLWPADEPSEPLFDAAALAHAAPASETPSAPATGEPAPEVPPPSSPPHAAEVTSSGVSLPPPRAVSLDFGDALGGPDSALGAGPAETDESAVAPDDAEPEWVDDVQSIPPEELPAAVDAQAEVGAPAVEAAAPAPKTAPAGLDDLLGALPPLPAKPTAAPLPLDVPLPPVSPPSPSPAVALPPPTTTALPNVTPPPPVGMEQVRAVSGLWALPLPDELKAAPVLPPDAPVDVTDAAVPLSDPGMPAAAPPLQPPEAASPFDAAPGAEGDSFFDSDWTAEPAPDAPAVEAAAPPPLAATGSMTSGDFSSAAPPAPELSEPALPDGAEIDPVFGLPMPTEPPPEELPTEPEPPPRASMPPVQFEVPPPAPPPSEPPPPPAFARPPTPPPPMPTDGPSAPFARPPTPAPPAAAEAGPFARSPSQATGPVQVPPGASQEYDPDFDAALDPSYMGAPLGSPAVSLAPPPQASPPLTAPALPPSAVGTALDVPEDPDNPFGFERSVDVDPSARDALVGASHLDMGALGGPEDDLMPPPADLLGRAGAGLSQGPNLSQEPPLRPSDPMVRDPNLEGMLDGSPSDPVPLASGADMLFAHPENRFSQQASWGQPGSAPGAQPPLGEDEDMPPVVGAVLLDAGPQAAAGTPLGNAMDEIFGGPVGAPPGGAPPFSSDDDDIPPVVGAVLLDPGPPGGAPPAFGRPNSSFAPAPGSVAGAPRPPWPAQPAGQPPAPSFGTAHPPPQSFGTVHPPPPQPGHPGMSPAAPVQGSPVQGTPLQGTPLQGTPVQPRPAQPGQPAPPGRSPLDDIFGED